MNAPIYFEIHADDLARAREFYTKLFGWEFKLMPEIPEEYYRIMTDGIHGGLLKRVAPLPAVRHGAPPKAGLNGFCNSMQVENFDEISKKIQELGGLVAVPKFAVPGLCWQGYFLDTEKNLFGIFQADENAK